jgi:threonine dehydratase
MSDPAGDAASLLTLAEIEAAREVVAGVARVTPIHESPGLSRLAGRPVLLKCEHLQRTGSFKIRGAYHHLATLPPEELAHGVVAASAGNHAQGVALAASLLGIRCVVFMPEGASLPKVQATREYGAEVRLVGATLDDSLAAARAYAAEGAHFVPPFDDRAVMAGQATLGLELDEQTPPGTTFVVSVGGGGLAGGIAAALAHRRPGARVVGVEAEGAQPMREALHHGEPVTVGRLDTMADGIRVGCVSDLTLAHAAAHLADVVTVSEDALARAVLLLLERAKAVVEPAGAATLAAVLDGTVGGEPGEPVCAVLSGGNVDPILLGRIIRHGLTAAGRYVVLRVVIDDVPGSLARLLETVAQMGLNVLEVEHHREGARLAVDEVAVRLTLETRDPEHRDTVIARMSRRGYVATWE